MLSHRPGDPALNKALQLRPLPLEGWIVGLCLASLLLLAWAFVFRMAQPSVIAFCSTASIGLPLLILMWAAMMVAMMSPSALPMMLAYARIVARSEPGASRLGLIAVFVLLYFFVWSAFGALAALAEWRLDQAGIIQAGSLAEPLYAGALLVVAGLYQWSAVKEECLARCHAPDEFIEERYRPGFAGAIRLGIAHSVACIGCCFMLMLLAFVGGSMHLGWMLALTVFVALEKLIGARVSLLRLSALVLLTAGVALMLSGTRLFA